MADLVDHLPESEDVVPELEDGIGGFRHDREERGQ